MTLWDLDTGKRVRSWKAHEAPVLCMEFDPTGTLLATGSADSTCKLWDIDRAICTHNLKGHRGLVSAMQFHPDGNRWMLFTGSDDCRVKVWDVMSKQCLGRVFVSGV